MTLPLWAACSDVVAATLPQPAANWNHPTKRHAAARRVHSREPPASTPCCRAPRPGPLCEQRRPRSAAGAGPRRCAPGARGPAGPSAPPRLPQAPRRPLSRRRSSRRRAHGAPGGGAQPGPPRAAAQPRRRAPRGGGRMRSPRPRTGCSAPAQRTTRRSLPAPAPPLASSPAASARGGPPSAARRQGGPRAAARCARGAPSTGTARPVDPGPRLPQRRSPAESGQCSQPRSHSASGEVRSISGATVQRPPRQPRHDDAAGALVDAVREVL